MSVLHPSSTRHHPIHTVHRVSCAAVGVFLLVFGVLGLTRRLAFLGTHGAIIMGLSSNGLLATVSVATSIVLIGAAARGGPTASTVGVGLGTLFLVSGLANLFVLNSAMNMLAFTLANVVFSLVVGLVLLFFGAYGRITGNLPTDSPYYHSPEHTVSGTAADTVTKTAAERATESMIDQELAEAERAVALHYATTEQQAGVSRASEFRTAEDRRRAWLNN
jgi:hypothetical protein